RQPLGGLAAQRSACKVLVKELESRLAMLDALTRDVADLHGRKGRRHLGLHLAGGSADLAGKLRQVPPLCGQVRRIARKVAGNVGNAAPEALQRLPAPARSGGDHAAERANLGAERTDLPRAELDAFENFF